MCNFCDTDKDGYVSYMTPTNSAIKGVIRVKMFITKAFGVPVLRTKLNNTITEFKINYCPICGKSLTERRNSNEVYVKTYKSRCDSIKE